MHVLGLGLATINPHAKLEVSISTSYKDIKGEAKCRKWSNLG